MKKNEILQKIEVKENKSEGLMEMDNEEIVNLLKEIYLKIDIFCMNFMDSFEKPTDKQLESVDLRINSLWDNLYAIFTLMHKQVLD